MSLENIQISQNVGCSAYLLKEQVSFTTLPHNSWTHPENKYFCFPSAAQRATNLQPVKRPFTVRTGVQQGCRSLTGHSFTSCPSYCGGPTSDVCQSTLVPLGLSPRLVFRKELERAMQHKLWAHPIVSQSF